jgi:hypothetical protein
MLCVYILPCCSLPLSPFFPICYFLLRVFFIARVFLFAVDCNAAPFKTALQLLEQRLKQGRAPEEVHPAHVSSPITLNVMWLHNTPAAATPPPPRNSCVGYIARCTTPSYRRCDVPNDSVCSGQSKGSSRGENVAGMVGRKGERGEGHSTCQARFGRRRAAGERRMSARAFESFGLSRDPLFQRLRDLRQSM